MTEEQKQRREQRKRAKAQERTPEESRAVLRCLVRNLYDQQDLRLRVAGRGLPKGKKPGSNEQVEIELTDVDQELLKAQADRLLRAEKAALQDVADHLQTVPFFRDVLSDKKRYRGIGPTMAGVILSEIDIHRCQTESALWRYAGLSTVPARRCKVCQGAVKSGGRGSRGYRHVFAIKKGKGACKLDVIAEAQTFESSMAERPTKGEKLPYNKFLKTKLVGVLGDCLIKLNSPWREYYDNYKHRLASKKWGTSDGHRHRSAIRYMIKMLLRDIWREWRRHEGLPTRVSYQEEYLGHTHHG
jgi:hypothetical protein